MMNGVMSLVAHISDDGFNREESVAEHTEKTTFLCNSIIKNHDTSKYYAQHFTNAINGYLVKIEENDKIAIIALDAATTGRLSVVYYDEMGGRQYVNAIRNWQQHCKWRRNVKIGKSVESKKRITCECTPAPRDVALAAFGTQRSERLEADGKLIRATVKRILPCITRQGIKIPLDLIKAATRRASMPQSMNEFVWYNDVLCVACAMIRFNYEELCCRNCICWGIISKWNI